MFCVGKHYGGYPIEKIIYKNKTRTCVIFLSSLPNGEKVAIKCLSTTHFSKQIKNELNAFNQFENSEDMVKCITTFRNAKRYCFVLKYAENGDLYDYISKRTSINEDSIKIIIFRVLSALAKLHDQGICHQDIKPENILLFNDESSAVLADFGSAEHLKGGEKSSSILGSPLYLSPEILTDKLHDQSADIWALGVTLYTLLSGELPFIGRNAKELLNEINYRTKRGITSLAVLKNVSEDAKSLISSMLEVNPENRISASEALKSPWFRPIIDDSLKNLTAEFN